ncbi:nucleoside/nucleotide kinase family protein [Cribrihabitans neustonicus]|uniref:nucleoside/nucleotide kinase family protein n=1 Tax=Cribrihabitans neustonicus TaxID=1429085 RepID=UPI003B5BA5F1
MTARLSGIGALASAIATATPGGRRLLVGLSGAPGSGKSTLAQAAADALNQKGLRTVVVPMDGFHLDNAILKTRGLLARKGAPETFDLGGFARLLAALRQEDEVFYPVFDRARDIAIAGAGRVGPEHRVVLAEGNYLLFGEPGWRDLALLWDVSVRVRVPVPELRRRLIARWEAHGLDAEAAAARAEGNDLANAARIEAAELPADIDFSGTPA